MGKNIRHIPDGQDFGPADFGHSKDFTFGASAQDAPSSRRGAPPSPSGDRAPSPGMAAEGGAEGAPATAGHPSGGKVVKVTHDPETGAVVHYYANGSYSMHHPDGGVTHHGADGQPASRGGEGPGEGTYLDRQQGAGMMKSAVHQHEDQEHGGALSDLRLAGGGKVGNDRGMYTDSGEPWTDMGQSVSRMSASEASGRQDGTKDYDRVKRVQDASVQPVRAIRKAVDYVGAKLGDVRDSAKSAISGDPGPAEFRQGQRAIRKSVLGYAGGGQVANQPMNRPPADPNVTRSKPNALPGGELAYGVQPGTEPARPPAGPGRRR